MKKIVLVLAFIITLLPRLVYGDTVKVAHLSTNPQDKITIVFFDYDRIHHYEPWVSKTRLLGIIAYEAHSNNAAYIYALCHIIRASELIKLQDIDAIDITDIVIRITEKSKDDYSFRDLDLSAYSTWDKTFMDKRHLALRPHEGEE